MKTLLLSLSMALLMSCSVYKRDYTTTYHFAESTVTVGGIATHTINIKQRDSVTLTATSVSALYDFKPINYPYPYTVTLRGKQRVFKSAMLPEYSASNARLSFYTKFVHQPKNFR